MGTSPRVRPRRAFVCVLALLAACSGGEGGGGTPPEPVRTPTRLVLDRAAVAVDEGATTQLVATVVDQNGEAFAAPPAGYTVTWSTSAPGVAAVSGAGVVSGELPGQAQVTATAAALTAAAQVTVNPVGGTVTGTVAFGFETQTVFSRGFDPGAASSRGAAKTRAFAGSGGGRALPRAAGPRHSENTLVVTYRAEALGAAAAGARATASRAEAARAASLIRGRLEGRLSAARGERVGLVIPSLRAARVVVDDPARLEEVRRALREDPAVASAEREELAYRQAVDVPGGRLPNDPHFPALAWAHRMMDLPAAWRRTTGSANVVVAVVDDGIRFDHPDLSPNLTRDGYDFVSQRTVARCGGGVLDVTGDGNGWDADPTIPSSYTMGSCAQPDAQGGHGTHVAGTIGATGDEGYGVAGVSWTVRVRPVRVLGVAGSGLLLDIVAGITYAAGLPVQGPNGQVIQAPGRAHVINLSLGGAGGADTYCPAVAAATAAGSLVVAAAGNDNTSAPFYPAACPEAISVTAIAPNYTRAPYSNYGATVDITAPGGNMGPGETHGIFSTVWSFSTGRPSYDFLHGTSMAAPHVSGVAALVLAQEPALTPAQLRARLLETTVTFGGGAWTPEFGAGVVNARYALAGSRVEPRARYALVYDVLTGRKVAQQQLDAGGAFTFRRLPPASYFVMAGDDAEGDGVVGVPGAGRVVRRWGGHAVGGRLAPVAVTLGGSTPVTATVGYGWETEPNNARETAGRVVVGGFAIGALGSASDADFFAVTVPGGTYTFETAGYFGACGLARDGDTVLRLVRADGSQVDQNDDVDFDRGNFCSRLTQTLAAGTYYLSVTASPGGLLGAYTVAVREGS